MKIFARALLALLLPALVISGYVFLPAAQAPSQEGSCLTQWTHDALSIPLDKNTLTVEWAARNKQ